MKQNKATTCDLYYKITIRYWFCFQTLPYWKVSTLLFIAHKQPSTSKEGYKLDIVYSFFEGTSEESIATWRKAV